MRTGPKTSGSPRGYRRRRHRPREVWSSPQRWTDGLGGRRDGRWPSRTPRTGSRWWLWYRPMCPPDPESEGFRRPSDREDIDYRVRGQLGLPIGQGQIMANALPDARADFYPKEGHISLTMNHYDELLSTIVG